MINYKQRFIIHVTIVILLIGCVAAQAQDRDEIKKLVTRWIEDVWNKADLTIIDEICSPDFTFNWAPPGTESNTEGYKQVVQMNQESFDNMNIKMKDMIVEGDKVAVLWKGTSTHVGEYMGIPATGKDVSMTGISILILKEGKLIKEHTEMDNVGMMFQLGAFDQKEKKE